MNIRSYPRTLIEAAWRDHRKLFSPDAENPPICMRCGNPLDGHLAENSLSRYTNAYICSQCGTEEALLDAYGEPLPLYKWHAMTHGCLKDDSLNQNAILTPFCSFEHILANTVSTSMHATPHPECEITYSRSDYDGTKWWTTWNKCQEKRTAAHLVREIDKFQSALMRMKDFKSLGTMRRLCRSSAETTQDPDEFNLYSETENLYIWLRLITRFKDYNLYVHYYQKTDTDIYEGKV